jgi:hypothetical protein
MCLGHSITVHRPREQSHEHFRQESVLLDVSKAFNRRADYLSNRFASAFFWNQLRDALEIPLPSLVICS